MTLTARTVVVNDILIRPAAETGPVQLEMPGFTLNPSGSRRFLPKRVMTADKLPAHTPSLCRKQVNANC